MDARLVELWLRLTADALHGADAAQKALEALGSTPMSADSLASWMKLWAPDTGAMPAGVSQSDASEFESMVEGWWHLMGVVPRYQYDDLKGRYDELQRRYEELEERFHYAEGMIARLRGTLSSAGQQADAQAMLDTWERLTRQTLDAQAEWTRNWLQGLGDTDRRDDR